LKSRDIIQVILNYQFKLMEGGRTW
jgi:hypothetical protein